MGSGKTMVGIVGHRNFSLVGYFVSVEGTGAKRAASGICEADTKFIFKEQPLQRARQHTASWP